MSVEPRLDHLRRAALKRQVAIAAALVAPLAIALVVWAARAGGSRAAIVVAVLGIAASAGFMRRAARRIDEAWLARRLDAAVGSMDDSAALLFRDAATLTGLQRLQQARLERRLADVEADLRPPWPWSRLAAAGVAAVVAVLLALAWHPGGGSRSEAAATSAQKNASATTSLRSVLQIEAPAYTHIAPRSETALDTKAPEGARIAWRLRFDPQPASASLQFHDGSKVALVRDGSEWRGERVLASSLLYRIVLDGAPPLSDDRLHRLDAIADRPPEVHVTLPDKPLTLLEPQQKNWELAFDASDDYGIASAALSLTLAQGSGENISFKEQTIALDGEAVEPEAGARHLRYRHTLDLATLGIEQGDDVIVRLIVSDNRTPKPNTTRSASFILRWPAEAASDSAGVEGIVQRTMPAYFRSQRQIIIDSEALLAEREKLDDAKFLARSDAIGVDQKILRLRYGQFLGEEAESQAMHDTSEPHEHVHAENGPARSFNEALHDSTAEARVDALAAAHEATEHHASGRPPPKFGEEGNTVAEYGHVHDIAEAATLLDPDTKATLKSALAEMWQSELHLRQGDPEQALPYERRALEYIKQVQQATRIYLARVGLELPVPDEARRLSGDRKDLVDRVGTLGRFDGDDPVRQLARALDAHVAPDWDAAVRWLHERESTLPDALGVIAAIDRARRAPDCAECRSELRDHLWPLLPTPAAGSAPRAAPDAAGRAYLDAVQSPAEPAR